MPLVYSCIAPHGGEVIPALAGDKMQLFSPTRRGMRFLAAQMNESRPDTIVIASPHNLRMPKHIGVVISENSSGRVSEGKREVKLRAKCDLELGMEVIREAEKVGLPVVGTNYGALEGPMSDLAMDWGTLVPLWFFTKGLGRRRKIVIVTPSRGIPLRQNYEFGRCIARASESTRKRVAFVASADQAHAHRKDGPYGFDTRARKYDGMVVDAVKGDRLGDLMSLDPKFVEGAKPDSLWQMTVLAGAISVVPMEGKLLSYQVPTYYGMLCAGFRPRA